MPHSPNTNHSKMDDAVIRLEQVQMAYKEIEQQLMEQRKELSPMVDTLTDPHERAVMRLRYLSGHSPQKIANDDKVPLSLSSVYNYLRRAEHSINAIQGWRQNG